MAFFLPDGEPWTGANLPLEAGTTSGPILIDLWHSKGIAEGDPLREIAVVGETYDSIDGVWRRDVLPPQVGQWLEARAIGQNAAAHPGQQPFLSGWTSLGWGSALVLPDIEPNCSRQLEVRVRVPSSAASGSWQWRLVALADEHASPLTGADPGILHLYGTAASALIRGGEVLPTSPSASGTLVVGARVLVIAGEALAFASAEVELDQLDGAGEALLAGETYKAAIVQRGAGLVVVKGARAGLPAPPAVELGDVILARVTVAHEEVTTIEAADIEGVLPARFASRAGQGLQLLIGPGAAHGGGTARWWSGTAQVPLEDDLTTTVWQAPTGLYDIGATPPMSGCLPIARVTTAAGVVTLVEDLRQFKGRLRQVQLSGAATLGEVGRLVNMADRAVIDRVQLAVDSNGGGSAGATVVDLEVNGVSIYPAAGRPQVAFDGETLVVDDGIPTGQLELRRGDLVVARVVELPTGGSPDWVALDVHLVEV